MVHFSVSKAVQAVLGFACIAAASPSPSPQNAADGNNPTYKDDSTFQSEMLNSTNTYRKMYGASTVGWNDTLATYAQNAADGCVFRHTGGPYGENIAEGYSSTTDTCQAWGNERALYSWSSPGFSEATGHFTQLVWKTSSTIGCGRAFCGGTQGWYVVCEYYPRGNIIGEFATEVGTLVSGVINDVSGTNTPTIPLQTVAAQSASLPQFTGAADRRRVGSGVAMVGVIGALVAIA